MSVPEVEPSKDGITESSLVGCGHLIIGTHLRSKFCTTRDLLEIVLWTLMTLSDVVDGC